MGEVICAEVIDFRSKVKVPRNLARVWSDANLHITMVMQAEVSRVICSASDCSDHLLYIAGTEWVLHGLVPELRELRSLSQQAGP